MIIYLIKSLLSLAFLYLGYLMIAKEKRFQLARFYLLGSVIISLLAPLLPISINYSFVTFDKTQEVFQSVSSKFSSPSPSTNHNEGQNITTGSSKILFLIIGLYVLGSLGMMYRYVRNLASILNLLLKSEKSIVKGCKLVFVREDIVPFSFGSYIFINQAASLENELNQHVLIHEQAHTKHLHSIDTLIIETLLIFYWFNPMLWVYRRSIKENHEYLADESVLKTKELAAYAEFLLLATQRNTTSLFGSYFNYFLTKKRLLMMNRTKTSKLNFGYKLAGTSLVFLVSSLIFAFEPIENSGEKNGDFVVVIDASHGGMDNGTTNKKLNLKEKDITLAISNELSKTHNTNKVTYLFTRKNDKSLSLDERVDFANKANANLVISLHMNESSDANQKGLEVYYSESNVAVQKSRSYAETFKKGIKIGESESKIKTARFKLIRNVNCPSVLLEMGFLSNNEDMEFMKAAKNQKSIAAQIAEVVNIISGT